MTKFLLLASVLSITACATDLESTGSAASDISFVSRTGTTIEIYDQADGGFGVAEIGDAAHLHQALPQSDASLSPSQIYALSAGDTDVPAEITALTAKLVAGGREFATTTPVSQVERPDATTCTPTFMNVYCELDAGNDITWCKLRQNAAVTEDHPQVHSTSAELCLESGSLTYRLTNGDGGDHEHQMVAGDWVSSSFDAGFLQATWYDYDVSAVTGNYIFVGEVDL